MKKLILLIVLISVSSTLTACNSSAECVNDSDCKILFSNCGCEAMSASDPRTKLEDDDRICVINSCQGAKAICDQGRCQADKFLNSK